MDDTENDAHDETGNSSNKRKNDQSDQPRLRAKRNRYISIACNECKRRKIKCNGRSPCQRCGNLNLECLYAPNCCNNFKESEEFQQVTSQMSSLQQHVDTLTTQVRYLKDQLEMGDLSSRRSRHSAALTSPSITNSTPSNTTRPARYHGPTSTQFNLGVAKSSLRIIGITEVDDAPEEHALRADESPAATPPTMCPGPSSSIVPESKDPIWSISRDEAIRLVQTWRLTIHVLHPFLDISRAFQTVDILYNHLDRARRSGVMMVDPQPETVSDDEITKLRLLWATAITLENGGPNELAESLFRSAASRLSSVILSPPALEYIEQLILAGGYAHFRDDETTSWRFIGLAGRMALELGLHKNSTYEKVFSTNAERYRASILLWSLYVLDRRYSFGTGLPFFIQESDIDPMILKPDLPYLSNAVELTAISSKIWGRVNLNAQLSASNVKDMEQLDFEVVQWYKTIPTCLWYDPYANRRAQQTLDPAEAETKYMLYFRANLVRILIAQPLFFSTSAIMENLSYANAVIQVAKDSIRVMKNINDTGLYKGQQALYNHYLLSALVALFLAVVQAPAQFSATCRDEFYMAVDFVRSMKGNSYLGRRLWRTIKVLKEVGPMLGLTARPASAAAAAPTEATSNMDAHSSAAAAMAGMAGHQMEQQQLSNPFLLPRQQQSGETWDGMTEDLLSLFESAKGTEAAYWDEQAKYLSHQDGWSRMFRDWF